MSSFPATTNNLTDRVETRLPQYTPSDAAIWARACGWALWAGMVAYPYYKLTNPTLAAIAHRAIIESIARG